MRPEMQRVGLGWAALLGCLSLGCFSPSFQPGLPCAEGDRCPGDLECISGLCQERGTAPFDAGPDAATPLDCGGDLGVADFFQCFSMAACSEIHDRCFGVGPQSLCVSTGTGLLGLGLPSDVPHIIEGVAEGTITYNGSAARTCLDSIDSISCDRPFAFDCGAVFTGTIADAGSCFSAFECSTPGAICTMAACESNACCAGSCVPPASLNEDCSDRGCVAGTYCFGNMCRAGDTDSPCGNNPLLKHTYCDPDHHCSAAQTCQPDLTQGQTCTEDFQCATGLACLGNNVEESTMTTCEVLGQLADPCDANSCTTTLNCRQDDPKKFGVCVVQPAPGETCIPDERCRGLQLCPAGGTCPFPGETGDPCTANNIFNRQCALDHFCTAAQGAMNPTCQPLGDTGDFCDGPGQCASTVCSTNQQMCEALIDCY